MGALYFKTDNVHPDENVISACSELLSNGKLIVFPTETVYGIGADAFDEEAVNRIYEVKQRPKDKPLLCHIYGLGQAEKLGILDEKARRLISLYTPGPLTLVVRKKASLPSSVVAGGDTVGLRFPSNGIFIELAKRFGRAIAATSANISGFESAKGSDDLLSLGNMADAVIDGGKCEYSLESTLLSLVGEPRILRQGSFPREKIEEVIGPCG